MRAAISIILTALCLMGISSCSKRHRDTLNGEKVLVAYFSATGNTEKVARQLSTLLDADMFEIEPMLPYGSADIDYNDEQSRCWIENRDSTIRPEIVSLPDLKDVDVIFIGYPIWWEKAPLPVYTFVESADLSGKTVIPFATSETSDVHQSAKALSGLRDNVEWRSGLLMNGLTDTGILTKIDSIINSDVNQ